MKTESARAPVQVAAFYRFVALPDFRDLRAPLLQACERLGLLGSILLAHEGINGTVSGPSAAIDALFEYLGRDARLADLELKLSEAPEAPFYRMKVRLKKEIVSLGVPGVDPLKGVGEYVRPEDWNALIERPDVRLIDTRNGYEYHLGSFAGAEDPQTGSFREFPAWVEENLDPARDQHVALFCTGGIRCEKATAYLRQQGFNRVYHLQGGILNYLEQVPAAESLWRGECFVFDNRVSVDHELAPGDHRVCPACRMPLSDADCESPGYEENVSCPRCVGRLTVERRAGLLERARQMELAQRRGDRHLGQRWRAESPVTKMER